MPPSAADAATPFYPEPQAPRPQSHKAPPTPSRAPHASPPPDRSSHKGQPAPARPRHAPPPSHRPPPSPQPLPQSPPPSVSSSTFPRSSACSHTAPDSIGYLVCSDSARSFCTLPALHPHQHSGNIAINIPAATTSTFALHRHLHYRYNHISEGQKVSSRPEQPAFSCARLLSAGCGVEGPRQPVSFNYNRWDTRQSATHVFSPHPTA